MNEAAIRYEVADELEHIAGEVGERAEKYEDTEGWEVARMLRVWERDLRIGATQQRSMASRYEGVR